ncbi:MAG: trigger factor [Alphaproteobacteria bacterium]
MQVTETKNEGLQREFTITISAAEVEEKVNTRLDELRRTVQIPGFRSGKAPSSLLRKKYGGAVMGEILEAAVSDTSQEAMSERSLRPAMQPKIEITSFEEGTDLEYTMAIEIMPEITPMDFSTLEVERFVAKIGDDEVEEALKKLGGQYRKSEPVKRKRKSRKGDVIVIDFKGSVDGVEFEGGAGEDHHLHLGEGQFIPGFEEQLIGAKVGEKVAVTVTFPEEYGSAELAGKEAVFDVDVKETREMVDTVIDDEFAKTMGQEDIESLRTAIRGRMETEYGGFSRERLKRGLLDKLETAHDFSLPEGMVGSEFDSIWEQHEQAKAEQSSSDDESAKSEEDDSAKSDDEIKEDYRKIARRRVQLGLLLTEVGDKNNVEVSAEDVNRALVQEAQKYPGQEKQVFEMYQSNPQAMASLRAPIFEEKVVDFILEMATVTEREVTPEELMRDPDAENKASDGNRDEDKKAD